MDNKLTAWLVFGRLLMAGILFFSITSLVSAVPISDGPNSSVNIPPGPLLPPGECVLWFTNQAPGAPAAGGGLPCLEPVISNSVTAVPESNSVAAVPEPATLSLLGLGLVVFTAFLRRHRSSGSRIRRR
jgi:hypothetical protein